MKNSLLLFFTFLVSIAATAQVHPITGRVTDDAGAPLQFVSVIEKGTPNGTSTDANGDYKISVKPNAVLVFSSVSHGSSEVNVNGRNAISIVLSSTAAKLSDVIVVAYGTQKRATVTSSQVSVSTDDFKGQAVTRLDQALQGRASGVQVTNTTGAPGGDVRIRIRGANSVSGNNDPLYVIDGFVGGDFNVINPDDVEDIEILKDAAATAPYGSRGSNGVVIITTKKGSRGKTQLSLTSRLSSSKIMKTYDKLNAGDYAETVNAYDAAVGINPYFTPDQISGFKTNGGTDWQKEIYRTAIGQQYELAVDGGSEKTTYHISGSYQNLPGIIKNSFYKFYNIRSNINTQLSNKFSTYINFNGFIRNNTNTFLVAGQANPVAQSIAWSPTVPLYDENGYHHLVKSDPIGSVGFNPIAEITERLAKTNSYNANIMGGLLYKIIPDLSLNVQYGVDYAASEYKNFGDLNVSPEGGYTSRSTGTSIGLQNTNTLNYRHTFNQDHHLDVTAVLEVQKGTWEGFNVGINHLIYPSFMWNNLSLGTAQQPGSGTTESSMVSLFGRVTYSYKDKYLFSGTIRRDASSVFRDKNKAGYFPSLSLGWLMSKEKFVEDLNIFKLLKLRGSWGLTGNQAVGAYSTYATYKSATATYTDNSNVPAIEIDRSENPDLKWETTEQKNIGLDMQFNTIGLRASVDYFNKDTRDLLFWVGLPMFTGGGGIEKNIGEVTNKGWEISLGATPFDSRNFSWKTDFNYSVVNNKIVKLTGEGDIFDDPDIGWGMTSQPEFVLREGASMGSFWGYKYLGTWKPKDQAEAALYNAVPGDSRYADLDGDKTIGKNDLTIIGNGLPRYTAGWNNTFTYKGIELNIFIQGVFGFDKLNFLYGAAMANGGDFRQAMLTDIKNRYIPGVNETSDIPAFSGTTANYIQSSRFVSRGDFIRFKNVSLAYTLPRSILKNIASVKFFASVMNLFTITHYKGMDPESANTGSGSDAAQNIDYGAYPVPRTFTGGITLSF
jgi:TonB-linked SusC/RagA family outer membrane protein